MNFTSSLKSDTYSLLSLSLSFLYLSSLSLSLFPLSHSFSYLPLSFRPLFPPYQISLSLSTEVISTSHTILIQNWMLYFIASYEEYSSPQSTGSVLLARRVTRAKASWGQCNYLACVWSTTFHHLSSLFTKMLWSQKSTYCLIKDISGNPLKDISFFPRAGNIKGTTISMMKKVETFMHQSFSKLSLECYKVLYLSLIPSISLSPPPSLSPSLLLIHSSIYFLIWHINLLLNYIPSLSNFLPSLVPHIVSQAAQKLLHMPSFTFQRYTRWLVRTPNCLPKFQFVFKFQLGHRGVGKE